MSRLMIAVVLVLAFVSGAFSDVPGAVNYQGYLTDDSGYPITGSLDMSFDLYDDPTVGTLRWTETWNSGTAQVIVTDGYYSATLGTYAAIGYLFEDYPALWLEVTVEGETLSPRKKLSSAPYSLEALNADTLDGLDSTDFLTAGGSIDADTLDGLDSKDFASASHSHSFSEITGSVTDAQVPDDITIDYAAAAGAVPWGGITGMPSGFSDGTDDVGLTTESDPQVGSNTADMIPKWDGNALVAGSLYDDGGIGLGTTSRTLLSNLFPGHMTIDSAASNNGILVKTDSTTTNARAGVFHQSSTSAGRPAVLVQTQDSSGSTEVFDVRTGVDGSTGTGGTSRFRVTQDGDVGIGVDGPQARLHVAGDVKIDGIIEARGTGTAIESLPYTISTSGLYYLADNLTSTGTTAITITANHVTLDLNGYTLTGTNTASEVGIYASGSRHNIEVRNGTITGFGSHGIQISTGERARILNMRVHSNGAAGSGMGIRVFNYAMVSNCIVTSNAGTGIYTAAYSIVESCISAQNGGNGIVSLTGGLIRRCTSFSNDDDGISVGTGGMVLNNVANSNDGKGIDALYAATIKGNSAYSNGEEGIYIYIGCSVIGNNARSNDEEGIRQGGSGSVIKDNIATYNQKEGIRSHNRSLVIDNTAYDNDQSSTGYDNIYSTATTVLDRNVAP